MAGSFTTNKQLRAWGDVLRDPDLAEAIVDRLLERGRALQLDGPSIRTKHVDSGTQPAYLPETTCHIFRNPHGRARTESTLGIGEVLGWSGGCAHNVGVGSHELFAIAALNVLLNFTIVVAASLGMGRAPSGPSENAPWLSFR